MEQGKYRLKAELAGQYDASLIHVLVRSFNHGDYEAALDQARAAAGKKDGGGGGGAAGGGGGEGRGSMMLDLPPAFGGIRALLQSPVLHHVGAPVLCPHTLLSSTIYVLQSDTMSTILLLPSPTYSYLLLPTPTYPYLLLPTPTYLHLCRPPLTLTAPQEDTLSTHTHSSALTPNLTPGNTTTHAGVAPRAVARCAWAGPAHFSAAQPRASRPRLRAGGRGRGGGAGGAVGVCVQRPQRVGEHGSEGAVAERGRGGRGGADGGGGGREGGREPGFAVEGDAGARPLHRLAAPGLCPALRSPLPLSLFLVALSVSRSL
eukprot:3066799-Rhodomonas_salina.1